MFLVLAHAGYGLVLGHVLRDFRTEWCGMGREKHWKKAHRVSWELANGPIHDGLLVCHRCDNPGCVNPLHLFLGTSADNNHDKIAKGRDPRGETHGRSKLNESAVSEMRREHRQGVSTAELGRRYGVSQVAAWDVVNGKHWKHVTA